MALEKRYSNIIFVIKFFWILLLVFQKSYLVFCDDLEDDSLKNALEAIEHRQRDLELQENDYYGQPENIGYGFHKTLGFFDKSGPTTKLGRFDSEPESEEEVNNPLLNYDSYKRNELETGANKPKSNFRERVSNSRNDYIIKNSKTKYHPQNELEYIQLLKNLWSKYRNSQFENLDLEDLTDEQVEEILNFLYDKDNDEERYPNNYDNPKQADLNDFESIPMRSRKNYRVFERFADRRKRYPSFGEGIYGKRNLYSRNFNYESPFRNEYMYSLKYTNPEVNKAIENFREEGFEVLGDEKDKDIITLLKNMNNNPKYQEEFEPFWLKNQNSYNENDVWLPGPVALSVSQDEDLAGNEKRYDLTPHFFKNHRESQINTKRFPVKRSSNRVRKEVKKEKISNESKGGIVSTTETSTSPTKKTSGKKQTEVPKKQKLAAPNEEKKVVRRADKYSKEKIFPVNTNEKIDEIFNVKKKSIDWSQYFGLNKRSLWLRKDYLKKAEEHFLPAKSKRLPFDQANVGNINFLQTSRYEMPFDTRSFNKKSFSYDIGSSIDRVEGKVGDIEEKIIDDAIKYTGVHSGTDKEDLNEVKNKVIQRLEAAYNLEKMKNALEKFRNLIKPEKNVRIQESLKKSVTEAPKTDILTTVSKENPNLENPLSEKKPDMATNKRIVIKKEGKEEYFRSEPLEGLEFLNYDLQQNQNDGEDCVTLNKLMKNCLLMEETGGRFSELFVPLCHLQQICYLCGPEIGFSKLSMCDSMFLKEIQKVCRNDSECLINAKNNMIALQNIYEQIMMSQDKGWALSGSCLSNPCMQKYFLNNPSVIYP